MDFVTRSECVDSTRHLEARLEATEEKVLDAIRDLKLSMNGQFASQGQLLMSHESSIAVLQDRSGRDVWARMGAVSGAVIAALAGYFSLK